MVFVSIISLIIVDWTGVLFVLHCLSVAGVLCTEREVGRCCSCWLSVPSSFAEFCTAGRCALTRHVVSECCAHSVKANLGLGHSGLVRITGVCQLICRDYENVECCQDDGIAAAARQSYADSESRTLRVCSDCLHKCNFMSRLLCALTCGVRIVDDGLVSMVMTDTHELLCSVRVSCFVMMTCVSVQFRKMLSRDDSSRDIVERIDDA